MSVSLTFIFSTLYFKSGDSAEGVIQYMLAKLNLPLRVFASEFRCVRGLGGGGWSWRGEAELPLVLVQKGGGGIKELGKGEPFL